MGLKFPVLDKYMYGCVWTHVLAGFVADHSLCTPIEGKKGTRKFKSGNEDGRRRGWRGKSAYPVISKAVFLENGPPEVFSNLISSLYGEL